MKIINFFIAKWHKTRHWFSSRWQLNRRALISNIASNFAWLYIVLTAVFKDGRQHYDILIAVIVMLVGRMFASFHPRETTEESRFREKRKILTSITLDDINELIASPEKITATAIHAIRKDILICIAQHVRHFRKDYSGIKIYSNLIVRINDEQVKVIVRNSPRKEGKVYNINELQSCSIFATLTPIAVGDAKAITKRNIAYRSFFALPVMDYSGEECIAVVTIDSTEPYHFDGVHEALETTLRPYIRTLAMTFNLENNME